MLKPTPYIILATFLISLSLYRIPTPIGLNITFSHVLFALVIYIGGLAFFSGKLKIHLHRDTRVLFLMFIIFACYSFLSFMRNIGSMKPESMSMYFSELVGYVFLLSVVLFTSKFSELQRVTKAFIASALFVYLGAFWHVYNFVVFGQYVTGIPFWPEYSKSEHVLKYLESRAWFERFPRFRLPFSTPAGTGIFLSLVGVILLALTLYYITSKKRGVWILTLLNLVNFFCLLGTFARASWALFLVGAVSVVWYFRKMKLISFGKIVFTVLVSSGLFFALMSLTIFGDKFFHVVGLRFSPEETEVSNVGHLKSRMLALKYWTENPIAGLGIGGFWLKPGGGIHTHSTYFTILVERGLIGLLLFLGFFFQLIRVLKRRMRQSLKRNDKLMLVYSIGFSGCLIGLLVGNFLYEMNTEVVWLFFAMAVAFVNVSSKEDNFDE